MHRSTPLRNGDFRLTTTLPSDRFGQNEQLAGPPAPNLDFRYVLQVSSIHPNHSNQKLQSFGQHWRPRTCRSTPLRHGDFRPKRTHPTTVLDPSRTWHAPYHQTLDVQHVPWVSWIHMNHTNLIFQPLPLNPLRNEDF